VSALQFTEQVDQMLTELESTPTASKLCAKLDATLKAFEASPDDWQWRKRRFREPECWGIEVSAVGEDWLIFWELSAADDIIIRNIRRWA
jgi:hypothetical protein